MEHLECSVVPVSAAHSVTAHSPRRDPPRGCAAHNGATLRPLTLQAVHVVGSAPPAGESPIRRRLFTAEPVHSLPDATAVVDHCRARWLIEEYFKALKSGLWNSSTEPDAK
jgi:hypothetical protein